MTDASAVWIGTTAGPVRIAALRHLPRAAAHHSLLRVWRSPAPADPGQEGRYRDLVDTVLRPLLDLPAEGAYLLEFETPLSDGESWRLAAALAHALQAAGYFAGAADPPPARSIWATGIVHRDGGVAAVELIDRKLGNPGFRAWLEAERAAGREVLLLAPEADAALARKAHPDLPLQPVASLAAALAILHRADAPAAPPPPLPPPPPPPDSRPAPAGTAPARRRAGLPALAIAGLVLVLAGAALLLLLPAERPPPPAAPVIEAGSQGLPARPAPGGDMAIAASFAAALRPVHAPPGGDCAQMLFGAAPAGATAADSASDNSAPNGAPVGRLCAIDLVVRPAGGIPVRAAARLTVHRGRLLPPLAPPPSLSGEAAFREPVVWRLALPDDVGADALSLTLRIESGDDPPLELHWPPAGG